MPSLTVPPTEAKLVLAAHVASAKQLIVAAAMVGDEDDFGVWSWRCKDWTSGLGAALRYLYGSDAARTFERATRAPRYLGSWQAAVGEELERLQETLAMLSELTAELEERDPQPSGAKMTGSFARTP